jgi:hypothetical protein
MNSTWKAALLQETRKLRTEHAPIWWDGFCNVLHYHQSSHKDDNPYMPDHGEERPHAEYKAGARAAESLLKALARQA